MADSSAAAQPHGLMANAVGLGGDFVVAIANVAPSSSVTYTLVLLLAFSGFLSPMAVLIVGAAMFCTAVGYARLNRWKASAGAPYVWVTEAVGPVAGIGTGFVSAMVSTLSNVGNITLAGAYLLFVVDPGVTFPNVVVWFVAAAIIGTLLWLSIRGIRPTVWVQTAFIVIEYAAVTAFVILALIHEASGAGGAHLPSLSDFTFGPGFSGFKGLAESAVVCGFLYLGWEAASVLGEESTKQKVNPGRAMMLGTGFLTVWYTFLIVVFQGVTNKADLLTHGTDALAYAGTLLVPGPLGRILPLAVLIAVIGTAQIQMTEPSRIVYSLARDRLAPAVLGVLHRVHRTPWVALVILAAIPPLALIPYLVNSSANTAIGYIISAAGMLGLFMYFAIAFSCVWFYRRQLTRSWSDFILSGVVPLLGGLVMLGAFLYGLTTQVLAVSLVSLAGVILAYLLAWIIKRSSPLSPFLVEFRRRRASGQAAIEAGEVGFGEAD
jgi:amino acid transporter